MSAAVAARHCGHRTHGDWTPAVVRLVHRDLHEYQLKEVPQPLAEGSSRMPEATFLPQELAVGDPKQPQVARISLPHTGRSLRARARAVVLVSPLQQAFPRA